MFNYILLVYLFMGCLIGSVIVVPALEDELKRSTTRGLIIEDNIRVVKISLFLTITFFWGMMMSILLLIIVIALGLSIFMGTLTFFRKAWGYLNAKKKL